MSAPTYLYSSEGTPKVLIDDDEPADRVLLRRLLRVAFGGAARVFEAPSLRDALRLDESFDIILLDYQLTDSEGGRSLALLLTRYDAPVVVITGHADQRRTDESARFGAHTVLAKHELSVELLQRSIQVALIRGAKTSDEHARRRAGKSVHEIENALSLTSFAHDELRAQQDPAAKPFAETVRDAMRLLASARDELLTIARGTGIGSGTWSLGHLPFMPNQGVRKFQSVSAIVRELEAGASFEALVVDLDQSPDALTSLAGSLTLAQRGRVYALMSERHTAADDITSAGFHLHDDDLDLLTSLLPHLRSADEAVRAH